MLSKASGNGSISSLGPACLGVLCATVSARRLLFANVKGLTARFGTDPALDSVSLYRGNRTRAIAKIK
ncbi:MAG TPA: hypothetical protein PKD38_16610 [Nitrospira sp.]|nr:hypothetical protein [Nitrospira sp.]